MKQKKPQLSAKPLTKTSIDLESDKLKDFIQAADFPSTHIILAQEKKNGPVAKIILGCDWVIF